ncbi:uncharacterized protein A1O5_04525 [Cladophialophora psammophila CBS 110553]|uniref:Uncharacterized protein n=1 Tax=Cladophialophora psammophila CBS 110553 TaxID=1182543 RepID=W9WUZ7_9EURO|nr:uncharacterized protein A1O5_04525 [Cladophialophora psammophila CBS 110553]EXJ72022.1 hypothetical protein A1O5_04525 [Cladophialophora psammophila CBS 110553]
MPRPRRTLERGRGPNISNLSQMLGFTDTKVLPKVLFDFWSPIFPHGRLADATDEQLAKLADDFLEKKGSDLWSVRGRGPVYPDDKDKDIKPKIFEILKRQRRNQLDVRMKRDRRQTVDSEEPPGEDDDGDYPEDDRASTVNPAERAVEGRRELNDNEADTTPPTVASSSAQPTSTSNPFHQPGVRVVYLAKRTDAPDTVQAQSSRAHSAPAVNPQKRGFEEMSADVSPAVPTATTQHATSYKRLVPENAFLALPAGKEARSNHKRPTVEDKSPGPNSTQSQSKRLSAGESHKLGPIGQNTLLERNPRTTDDTHRLIHGNGVAISYPSSPPDNGIGYPAATNRYQNASQARQNEPSDQELRADEQAESISYDIFQNNYSVDLHKVPGLLRFLLKHCEDNIIQNRQKMRDGLTAEDRLSARSSFFALREMLNALQGEGLRVGAQLNY